MPDGQLLTREIPAESRELCNEAGGDVCKPGPFPETPAERRQRNHAPNTGRLTRGNTAALKHGAYSKQLRRELLESPEAVLALAEKRQGIVADLGGAEAVGVVKGDTIGAYLECDVMRGHLAKKLLEDGIFSARGRVRSAFTAYVSLLDRHVKLAGLLGLERRQRAALSLDDYIRAAAQQAAPDGAGATTAPTTSHVQNAPREAQEGRDDA